MRSEEIKEEEPLIGIIRDKDISYEEWKKRIKDVFSHEK